MGTALNYYYTVGPHNRETSEFSWSFHVTVKNKTIKYSNIMSFLLKRKSAVPALSK
jgi:hypothetical protein